MILGTGIDIVEVERIRAALGRFGDRFGQRVLTAAELDYCRRHRDVAPYLAARFAGKEAVSKAFGTGIGAALGWLDIEIGRRESGEPHVILLGKARELFAARNATALHITLSHTASHAVAVAILEGESRS
jgi:holo-[acyl-carrier protein] synthase